MPPTLYTREDAQGATKGSTIIATGVTFLILGAVATALRLYTRISLVRKVGVEDYFIFFAWLFALGFVVLVGEEVRYGAGRHMATLTSPEITKQIEMLYLSILSYRLSLLCTQCSIILQYLRLFTVQWGVRRVCWTLLALTSLYNIATFFAATFTCWPVKAFWDASVTGARCIDRTSLWFTNSAIGIVIDLALIITPIPALKSLNLPKKQKIALILVFAVGSFAVVTSILRLYSLYVVTHSDDITWDNANTAIWSAVEVNVGVICACLPTLKPLFIRVFPSLMTTITHTSNDSPNGTYTTGKYTVGSVTTSQPSPPIKNYEDMILATIDD